MELYETGIQLVRQSICACTRPTPDRLVRRFVVGGQELAESGRLQHQVIPLRHTGRTAGRTPIVRNRSLVLAGHFQQMGTNGLETMTLREPWIGVECA